MKYTTETLYMNKPGRGLDFNARSAQIIAMAESGASAQRGNGKGNPGKRRAGFGRGRSHWVAGLRGLFLHPLTLSVGLAMALTLVLSASARA
jgi:hypothetical protein